MRGLLAIGLCLAPLLVLHASATADIDDRDVEVLAALHQDAPGSQLVITTSDGRTNYNIGDTVVFRITSRRGDWYLTIFDFQTSGSVVEILPNRYSGSILLRSGQTRLVPSEADGFRYRVAGKPGVERILVIGTSKPISLTPGDIAQFANPNALFRTIGERSRFDFLTTTRDILVEQTSQAALQYTVATLTFTIESQAQPIPPSPEPQPPQPEPQPQPPQPQPPRPPTKWAVIVGIARYPTSPLRYTVRDANAFYSEGCQLIGIPRSNCVLLLDEKATAGNFVSAVLRLSERVHENDTFYVFFSGHGTYKDDDDGDEPDGKDEFLCFVDKLLRDDTFYELMQRVHARCKVLFLDSCFSGGAARGVRSIGPPRVWDRALGVLDGFWSGESVHYTRDIYEPALPRGNVLLAASLPNQPSLEDPRIKHGVFTYYLLKGLRGEADFDGDRKIRLDELRDYLKIAVPRHVATMPGGGRQDPYMAGAPPRGFTVRP